MSQTRRPTRRSGTTPPTSRARSVMAARSAARRTRLETGSSARAVRAPTRPTSMVPAPTLPARRLTTMSPSGASTTAARAARARRTRRAAAVATARTAATVVATAVTRSARPCPCRQTRMTCSITSSKCGERRVRSERGDGGLPTCVAVGIWRLQSACLATSFLWKGAGAAGVEDAEVVQSKRTRTSPRPSTTCPPNVSTWPARNGWFSMVWSGLGWHGLISSDLVWGPGGHHRHHHHPIYILSC
jgi:hypothetical protein